MIDDFANQKWTWDHKLVDGYFFDRQWIDYTKAKCRPWLSQRDFGRSNQLAAGGWGAGRGPGSCWPNQRRPAVLPFESVTGGGKNMSAVDDDLPKRYQPLCTVWVVPSDEAFEVPPSVCRFSGLVRAFLKEETGSCDFNLAHNYQHKKKIPLENWTHSELQGLNLKLTCSNSSKDKRPLPEPDWSRSTSSIIRRTSKDGILKPQTSSACLSSDSSMYPDPSRSICNRDGYKKNRERQVWKVHNRKSTPHLLVIMSITQITTEFEKSIPAFDIEYFHVDATFKTDRISTQN